MSAFDLEDDVTISVHMYWLAWNFGVRNVTFRIARRIICDDITVCFVSMMTECAN